VSFAAAFVALSLAGTPATGAPLQKPGVVRLPGLAYEVLHAGPPDGVSPTRADSITVRYRGWLADAKVFNTSADEGRGTTTFALNRLIPGWVAALQMMRPGDRWRLIIPPYLAYGRRGKPEHDIPPDATLTFEVELVAVTPAPSSPESK
jgi:FKBP-type peptidyl-prolyl cis-trans isomerase FklB